MLGWARALLSPVLSALLLAPLMKIFNRNTRHLDVTLLSYIDDETIIVQSKELNDNLDPLQEAYGIIFTLFEHFALVLEHDKSELFHFSQAKNQDNPSLDLEYHPYTGNTPLKPK